jgi:hypothetical protein
MKLLEEGKLIEGKFNIFVLGQVFSLSNLPSIQDNHQLSNSSRLELMPEHNLI